MRVPIFDLSALGALFYIDILYRFVVTKLILGECEKNPTQSELTYSKQCLVVKEIALEKTPHKCNWA